jgi:hypothetical protein
MKTPDYSVKSMTLAWARGAAADGYAFQPDSGMTRRRDVERLFSMMNNAKQVFRPSVTWETFSMMNNAKQVFRPSVTWETI